MTTMTKIQQSSSKWRQNDDDKN